MLANIIRFFLLFLCQLTIGPDNSFENYLEARRFFHNKSMNRRGKPVDGQELVHLIITFISSNWSLPFCAVNMQRQNDEKLTVFNLEVVFSWSNFPK